MKKRVLGGILAAVLAVTSVPAAAEENSQSFGYDVDAMTIPAPVNIIVPASVSAFLNPYGVTVTFNRQTLKRDENAQGEDRLELTGDVISPTYTIENAGNTPIRVYAGVKGQALGSAVLVDPATDVSEWNGSQNTRDVNLWVTGGLSEEAVTTTSYSVANSISITETENTRSLIEYLDGSTKGYFKINGKLNKHAKGWSSTDGVHINFALKIVPIDA